MKKTSRDYGTQLAALIPGYFSLAPATQSVRRDLKVKADSTEFVWRVVEGRAVRALVDLGTGEVLWEEGAAWAGCSHARAEAWGWRGDRRCADCGHTFRAEVAA